MAETRSDSQANQAQVLEQIMLALSELKTAQSDSAAKLKQHLELQQHRLEALEQHTPSDEDGAAGAALFRASTDRALQSCGVGGLLMFRARGTLSSLSLSSLSLSRFW